MDLQGIQEADRSAEGFYIRSGVTVILKNSVITDGFVIWKIFPSIIFCLIRSEIKKNLYEMRYVAIMRANEKYKGDKPENDWCLLL